MRHRQKPVARVSRRTAAGLLSLASFGSLACSEPAGLATDARALHTPLAAAVPTGGLVGEWKLEGNANDTKFSAHGTLFGSPTFVMGTLGSAIRLNNGASGTGGKYVEILNTANLENVQENNYTISAWYYPYRVPANSSSDNTFATIVSKYGQHMGIVYNSAGKFVARHYVNDNGNVLLLAQSTVRPDSAWYHVASVVHRANGTLKIYVNGALQVTENFSAGLPAREYNQTPFRVGRAQSNWAADGLVDQVRIYNVALSDQQIDDLYNESAGPSGFRFPLSMTKGQQTNLLGNGPMPDGQMAAQSPGTVQSILQAARDSGARITLRVTPPNPDLTISATNARLSVAKWKAAFNDMENINADSFVATGTLVGLMAIDEPFSDFDFVTGAQLDSLCQHQKSKPKWNETPCLIRELNTRLHDERPGGNAYQWVDAGWAQVADHHYVPANKYGGDMGAYFRDNLAKGDAAGLGLMYGFNLINGGRENLSPCDRFDGSTHNCAMRASEINALADTLAEIAADRAAQGKEQGCGVNGWWITSTPGAERNYYFRTDIQGALQNLNTDMANTKPGTCS